MENLHDFIETNMVVVNFVYGLVYFTFGMAIALQRRSLSNFRLARHLWLLAAFGIIHGIAEWGLVFIPIQEAYLASPSMDLLINIQTLAWAISYAFMLQFAVVMLAPRLPWVSRVQAFIRWYAPVWSAAVMLTAMLLIPSELSMSWIRYTLGLPGGILTAMVFWKERRSFREFPAPSAKLDLTLAAAAFAVYAVLGGLVVPNNGLWPISWLNYHNVFTTTGLPIQFYRALAGLFIAIFVIRTLSVFDLEIRHRLEATEKKHALLEDRQRIARDLHDGVIQDIYAAGLQLEATAGSLETHPYEVTPSIKHVLRQLNEVISDIRGYIFELCPARAGKFGFNYYIKHLVDELSAGGGIDSHLIITGTGTELSSDQKQNITLIVRECLSNVIKHSLASSVDLKFLFEADGLSLAIEDDGIGIDSQYTNVADLQDTGGGMGNIAARAIAMGADLSIQNMMGGSGTRVVLWIPYKQEKDAASTPLEISL